MYTLSGIQLINIFCYTSEFETVSILISSYLLEVALEFTLNAMLFTDDVISKRYENGGSVDIMTTLMLSFCSNMISNVLATLISKLTNFNIVLESIKLEVKDQNEFYYPAVELLPHHCTGKTKATGKTCVLQTFFFTPIKSNFLWSFNFHRNAKLPA